MNEEALKQEASAEAVRLFVQGAESATATRSATIGTTTVTVTVTISSTEAAKKALGIA